MLVKKIQDICKKLNWTFNYGRSHWQNLLDLPDDSDKDFEDRGKYFLLLFQNKSLSFDSFSVISRHMYEAQAIFCVGSRFADKDYNEKYEKHIEKLSRELMRFVKQFPSCDGWALTKWEEVEVENTFDTNLDGLLLKFNMDYSGYAE